MSSYREVKADILGRITRGDWPPGSLLPGEVDLAARYECARATVNRAMRELADDGIIERRRKAGTRVRKAPARQARFDIPLVRREVEDSGATYGYQLLSREVLAAPDRLRDKLDLAEGTEVLHLGCLHRADDQPYQVEDRWINLAALPQAREANFAETGPNEWLVATVPYTEAEISFAAIRADARLANMLNTDEGAALFAAERATWLRGQAITFVRLVYRHGHRVTARY